MGMLHQIDMLVSDNSQEWMSGENVPASFSNGGGPWSVLPTPPVPPIGLTPPGLGASFPSPLVDGSYIMVL